MPNENYRDQYLFQRRNFHSIMAQRRYCTFRQSSGSSCFGKSTQTRFFLLISILIDNQQEPKTALFQNQASYSTHIRTNGTRIPSRRTEGTLRGAPSRRPSLGRAMAWTRRHPIASRVLGEFVSSPPARRPRPTSLRLVASPSWERVGAERDGSRRQAACESTK